MSTNYLIRFDDVCPTMNWSAWDSVEAALRQWNVRPILAVVPENRDPKLRIGPPHPDFWSRVRAWDRLGWTIAMHGYQHVYATTNAGIVGLNQRSEFAGLARDLQAERLDAAFKVFREQGIVPVTWVAPGHSFDQTTVECLRERGITVISDGFYFRVVRYLGCTWVPQQLWRFRQMPAGTWTVCCHINKWKEGDIARFGCDLARYHGAITSIRELLDEQVAERNLGDIMFSSSYRQAVMIKRLLSGCNFRIR